MYYCTVECSKSAFYSEMSVPKMVFVGSIDTKLFAATTLKVLCEEMGVNYRSALKWMKFEGKGGVVKRSCGGYVPEFGNWKIEETELLKVSGRGKSVNFQKN